MKIKKRGARYNIPLIYDYVQVQIAHRRSGLPGLKRVQLWVLQSDVANIVISQWRVISNETAARQFAGEGRKKNRERNGSKPGPTV